MDSDRRAGSERTGRRAGRRSMLLRYGLGLAALAAAAFFFVRERALFAGFGATLGHLNWAWVVVAFAAELASLPPLALAGVVIAGDGAESILLPLLGVVVAGSGGAALLFRHPRFMLRTVGWTEVHLGQVGRLVGRLTQGFCRTARALGHVHPSMGLWSVAWGLSVVNWLLDAACLALSFAAVHAPVPWGAVLLAFAGAKVVSSIGITPGGLGIVEAGLVATFVAYGVRGAHAGAAVLVYRVLTLIGLVGIGWLSVALLAVEDRRRARSSHGPQLAMEPAKRAQQRSDDP